MAIACLTFLPAPHLTSHANYKADVFNFWYFIESGRKKKSEGKRNMELPEVQSKKRGKKVCMAIL